MHPFFIERFVHHVVVTSPAKLKARLFDLERGGCSGLLMALLTHLIGNGRMHMSKQDDRLVRAMGVMATGTARIRHGVIQVLLSKNGAVSLVTCFTEGRHVFFQEIIVCGGCVWVVAGEAILLNRGMPELGLCYGISERLMALKTEFIPRLYEIELVFCSVRVMALNAFTVQNSFMDAVRLLRGHPFMAIEADRVWISRQ
jgi:hypothetical protein